MGTGSCEIKKRPEGLLTYCWWARDVDTGSFIAMANLNLNIGEFHYHFSSDQVDEFDRRLFLYTKLTRWDAHSSAPW